MRKIAEHLNDDLEWSQTGTFKREFDLAARGVPIGSLRFRSAFGSLATAESGDGCWTFKRVGFFQTRVAVRRCDAEAEIASFKNNMWSGGGMLVLADGRPFRATTNFWSSKLRFEDEAGQSLVRFDYGGMFKLHARVEIAESARTMPELPLLVLLGWYLAIMLHADASGASSAGAAAAAAG